MGNSGFAKGKSLQAFVSKRLVLALFRLGTLSLVLIELAFDPQESNIPENIVVVAIILYTGFKLIHPFRWYLSPRLGTALSIIDVTVCASFVLMHWVIHTPFVLYALNPVLTAALLFPHKVTWIIGGVTAVYYTVHFLRFPLMISLELLSSMFVPYLVALGATAWLPYIINFNVLQRVRSSVISEERLKLGRELHDGICQTIYGLRLELQTLNRNINRPEHLVERLAHLNRLLDEAEKEARGSIELLRSFKSDQPLLAQIEDSLEHLKNETGIEYRLEAPGEEPRLDDLVKLEVLYICGEALKNIAKHSGAHQVTVRVNSPNGHIQINIADDGRGFADDRLTSGHGLMVMKERAESLGGNFQVVSVPGYGTEIRMEVPRTCLAERQMIR